MKPETQTEFELDKVRQVSQVPPASIGIVLASTLSAGTIPYRKFVTSAEIERWACDQSGQLFRPTVRGMVTNTFLTRPTSNLMRSF
ncbi:MAG: hypothetical protein Fues2KO_01340 [Fuerstiella sp.]